MEAPADLKAWRRELRQRLLTRRTASTPAERSAWNRALNAHLAAGFPALGGLVVGFCWPYKGEPDPRPWIRRLRQAGARVVLPAVVAKGQPLEFREWWPQAPMAAGALGIPMPVGTPVLVPDAVLVPPVGFDAGGWRLGYGGGYFDRTLETLTPHPVKICLAYELARIPTIHPQPHDIPMDFVVTEAGLHAVEPGGLQPIDAAACDRRVRDLLAARQLPRRQRRA
ncbi:MAG: 5-formyltetrahydrofolate cyclo-ligase [Opitutaceae bacterium]|nr:5-formyltetrahydrofolate cyclo-ligase [Opitutaceae bacterium]